MRGEDNQAHYHYEQRLATININKRWNIPMTAEATLGALSLLATPIIYKYGQLMMEWTNKSSIPAPVNINNT